MLIIYIMNLFRDIIILIIGLTPIFCFSQTNKTAKTRTENSAKEKNYLVTDKGVLGLVIGKIMPGTVENFKLTKSIKIVDEGNEEPIIHLTENNTQLIQIGFLFDQGKGNYSNKIGEIFIKDKRFRTEKNIGVKSTIDDFISAYNNYKIWYTYVSGMFVIQSNDMKIQFILDERGYIGKKNLTESDMVVLKKDDFSSNTRIVKIRIY